MSEDIRPTVSPLWRWAPLGVGAGLTALYAASQFAEYCVYLVDPWVVYNDARLTGYLVYGLGDNPSLAKDIQTELYFRVIPAGSLALVYLLHFLAGPVLVSKLLQGLCVLVASVYAFLTGRRWGGNLTGLFLVFLLLSDRWMTQRMCGGLPRGFGMTLLVVFTYYLLAENRRALGLVIVASPLFYPMLTPIFCAAALARELWRAVANRYSVRQLARTLAWPTGAALIAFLLLLRSAFPPAHIGRPPTIDEVVTNVPESYMQGGRRPLYPLPSVAQELRRTLSTAYLLQNPSKKLRGSLQASLHAALAVGLLLLALLGWVRRESRPGLMDLAAVGIAGIVMFLLARLFAFRLYEPPRYIEYTLPWMVNLYLALGLFGALQRMPLASRFRGMVQLGCFVVAAATPSALLPPKHKSCSESVEHDAGLLEAIGLLPADSLVAGHPGLDVLSHVAAYTERGVLMSFEGLQPHWRGYYKRALDRVYDTIAATYSTDPAILGRLAHNYGVTHLLLGRAQLSQECVAAAKFLPEFDRKSVSMLAGVRCEKLPLRNIPAHAIVFADERYVLVDLEAAGLLTK